MHAMSNYHQFIANVAVKVCFYLLISHRTKPNSSYDHAATH